MAKELLTRIALKYDTYANWTDESVEGKGANLVLLAGEIGICEIENKNQGAQTAPTVLFKVGNGKDAFKSLQWASAKAADVYDWAKASDVTVSGKTINFVGTNKSITLDFITEAEVRSKITNALAERISKVEASIGDGGDIENRVADVEERVGDVEDAIDVINGTGDGSIAKAKADAISAAATDATTKANAAEAAAKADTEQKVSALSSSLNATLSGHTSAANPHNITKETVGLGNVDNKSVATIKSEFTGAVASGDTGFATGGAVHTAIEAAKTAAANDAAAKIETLVTSGQVKTNTDKIAGHTQAISALNAEFAEGGRVTELEGTVADHEGRLDTLEVFFAGADADGEDKEGSLYNALDTLKEIQKFITDEGTAADEMVKSIEANTEAIDDLEAEFAAGGRVTAAEAAISGHTSNITSLQELTSGYSGAGSIKGAVDAAAKAASDANTAAGVADGKAVAAQKTADEVKTAVNDETNGLVATKGIASGAASEASRAHGRLDTVEGNITTIQGIVSTGADANSKLRKDITELQGIVKTGADANTTLRSDLTDLAGRVTTAEGTLVTTTSTANTAKTKAEDAVSRVAAIEGDYLKAADEFIFNCGSSTTVVHTN